jgi:hypothetical protein
VYFLIFFPVFAQSNLAETTPTGIPLSPLLHLTPLLSIACALFFLTALTQLFSFQLLPHSFYRNGGCTPSRSIFIFSSALLSCLARASRESVRDFTPPRKTRICKSFVFRSLRTLPSSVSRNPFICHSYENNRGVYQLFPLWNSAPILKSLVARSSALFVRSFHSFTKECFGTLFPPTRSALFLKTAGCGYRGIDPASPFYSPCVTLPPGSGRGLNHHETSSLPPHPMENRPGITPS